MIWAPFSKQIGYASTGRLVVKYVRSLFGTGSEGTRHSIYIYTRTWCSIFGLWSFIAAGGLGRFGWILYTYLWYCDWCGLVYSMLTSDINMYWLNVHLRKRIAFAPTCPHTLIQTVLMYCLCPVKTDVRCLKRFRKWKRSAYCIHICIILSKYTYIYVRWMRGPGVTRLLLGDPLLSI